MDIRKIPGGNELLNPEKILKDDIEIGFGNEVADLGCGGKGYFTLQSAKLVGDKGKVYAIDVLKSILTSVETEAKIAGLSNIQTVWSNLEIYQATKIKDESLDLALLFNILFQNKKQREILRESARMIKEGGRLAVIDWKTTGAPFGPPKEIRISPEKVREMAQEIGLKEEKFFEAGLYHYGMIFSK